MKDKQNRQSKSSSTKKEEIKNKDQSKIVKERAGESNNPDVEIQMQIDVNQNQQ